MFKLSAFKYIDKFELAMMTRNNFCTPFEVININQKSQITFIFIKDALQKSRFWPKNKNYTLGSLHKKWIDANEANIVRHYHLL